MSFRETAVRAAKKAGEQLEKDFEKGVKIERKGRRELVSEADRKAEEAIREVMESEYPDHSILGEELGEKKEDNDFKWIIDPLDGSTNFLMKNPFFNTSVALAKGNEIIVGVVYNPLNKELFTAEKGKGAYLNGEPIQVSDTSEVENSLLTYCHGRSDSSIDQIVSIFHLLKKGSIDVRRIGAGALELCYVASGRVDAFIDNDIKIWDEAAGSLIVKEAGGKVTDFEGLEFDAESNSIIAAPPKLQPKLKSKIKQVID